MGRLGHAFGTVAVNHHLTRKFMADLEKAGTTYQDDWISANMVKFFMDGAPSAPLYTTADYTAIVTELDKRNFQVMSHALSAPAARSCSMDTMRWRRRIAPRIGASAWSMPAE